MSDPIDWGWKGTRLEAQRAQFNTQQTDFLVRFRMSLTNSVDKAMDRRHNNTREQARIRRNTLMMTIATHTVTFIAGTVIAAIIVKWGVI
jgi:hypothetical protein